MKRKILQICLFLSLCGLILMTPIVRVSAENITWNLGVTNLAGVTINYTYDQLLAMSQSNVNATLYCYGTPLYSGEWTGVSLSYLLQQAELDPAVLYVNFLGSDGYQISLTLAEAMASDTIIAYELNGAPLDEVLRLVLPAENGAMWIDVITNITMSTTAVNSAENISPSLGGSPPNTSPVPSPTQQPSASPQPTNTELPTPSPTVTQPTPKVPATQPSTAQSLAFPFYVVYAIAVGIIIVAVAAVYVAYRYRHRKGPANAAFQVSLL
jgi:DMSO/TMAO reductase YedYZ molybdopterin-dependent catalytic subunit